MKNLKKAIENNHDISIESDIRFSDNTFSYDEDTTKPAVTVSMDLYNEKRRLELEVNK